MKAEEIIDLSRTLSPDTPVWPGDPRVGYAVAHESGAIGFRLATLTTAMHAGTHLDAPRHYFAAGGDAASIPLSACVGRAVCLRVEPADGIVATVALELAWDALAVKRPRIIVDTGFGSRFGTPEYFSAFPGFEPSLIDFLKKHEIVLFGVDLPSVKYGRNDGAAAHADLLGARIAIVETLAATDLLPAEFAFSAAPLKLAEMDGSPVRAYAVVG